MGLVLGWGQPMTNPTEHGSDFKAEQLVLFGVAAIALLVFAFTYVY